MFIYIYIHICIYTYICSFFQTFYQNLLFRVNVYNNNYNLQLRWFDDGYK
jgi:hypothetical protein